MTRRQTFNRIKLFLQKWFVIDWKKRNRWSYVKIFGLEIYTAIAVYLGIIGVNYGKFLLLLMPLWLLVLWADEKEEE